MNIVDFIKTIKNPVIIVNTNEARVVDINESALQLFGFSEIEILNLQTFPIYEDADASKAVDTKTFKSGEYYLKTKNNNIFDIYIIVSHIGGLANNEVALFIQEISSENFKKKINSFQQFFSNLSNFTARIVHEIRNPLGIIIMNLQFLQQTGHDKDRAEINFAIKASNRITNILERIASLIHLGDNTQTDHDVNSLMMEAIQAILIPIKEKNLQLDLHLDEDLPAIKINSKQITEAFKNILKTVIYYSPENSRITVTSGILELSFAKPALPPYSIFVVIKDSNSGVSIEEFNANFNMSVGYFIKSSEATKPFTTDFLMCNNAKMQVEKSPDGGLITRIIFSQKNNI